MCHNCAYLNAPNFLLLMFLNLPQHHLCLFNSWFHTSLVQNHLHFHTGVVENKFWHQKLGLRTPSLGDSEICITATEIATPFGNKISNLGLGNVFAQFSQMKNSFSSKIHEYILNWFPECTEQGQQCSVWTQQTSWQLIFISEDEIHTWKTSRGQNLQWLLLIVWTKGFGFLLVPEKCISSFKAAK